MLAASKQLLADRGNGGSNSRCKKAISDKRGHLCLSNMVALVFIFFLCLSLLFSPTPRNSWQIVLVDSEQLLADRGHGGSNNRSKNAISDKLGRLKLSDIVLVVSPSFSVCHRHQAQPRRSCLPTPSISWQVVATPAATTANTQYLTSWSSRLRLSDTAFVVSLSLTRSLSLSLSRSRSQQQQQ